MGETHKKFNLRVAEDDKTVLLDRDVSTDELEELVAAIGKELEALGIKDPPDQKQLKEQLNSAAEKDPHLVDFVLIKGEPLVPPKDGKVEWEGDLFKTTIVEDPSTGKIDYREKGAHDSVTKDTLLGHQIPEGEIELSLGERAPDV